MSETERATPQCPQPCVHLSQEDSREGRACIDHPCTCAQSEPSTAQAQPSYALLEDIEERVYRANGPGPGLARAMIRAGWEAGWDTALRAAAPQGDPTDAQVRPALRVFFDGNPDFMSDPSNVEDMRAALRAAGKVLL